ncbi:rod shape-determining protein MreC [Emcibacter sp. SYSU 3D8]|uniref:rod shape-determining protein MreC n=1 Tax=Emcibacter sp. SYSU 3D8 TaxID=3133969 RepID=UPI0031FE78B4
MAPRLPFAIFVAVSFGLLIVSKVYPTLNERVQGVLIDVAAPVVDVLGEPVTAVRGLGVALTDTLNGAAKVEALREENERLRRWRNVAMRLDDENAQLRALMRVSEDIDIPAISARVVSDPGGPFVRAILLDAGVGKGISKFQPVMDQSGVVGRIVTVGRQSSRALLLTDLNSRIPVFIRRTGDRAILVGDNSDRPKLAYLPMQSSARVGDEVFTSGDGGIFPPKLAVGVVDFVEGSTVRVNLTADLSRLDYVNVMAYEPLEKPEQSPVAQPLDGLLPGPALAAETGGIEPPMGIATMPEPVLPSPPLTTIRRAPAPSGAPPPDEGGPEPALEPADPAPEEPPGETPPPAAGGNR